MNEIVPGIHLLDLQFREAAEAIGAYLLVGEHGDAALIETGPTTTLATLLRGVNAAGIDPSRISDVVVTHIHLDHAGGAGVLLRDALPNARLWVHPVGGPHLIDPTRLLTSATRLYGDMMQPLWGEVAPIPKDRVHLLQEGACLTLAGHDVDVLFTPGHAAHHIALHHKSSDVVFAGDAAGVRLPASSIINPPTVPPEFDLAAWETTLTRLEELSPSALVLTHFGLYHDVQSHLQKLRERLHHWIETVHTRRDAGDTGAQIAALLQEEDAANAGGADSTEAINRIAGYGISVAGIERYLVRSQG